ncbi:MAG: CapA family protein [Candidatus Cryptobacteroides sp.]
MRKFCSFIKFAAALAAIWAVSFGGILPRTGSFRESDCIGTFPGPDCGRPFPKPADTLKVVIVGDIMLHTAQIENCFARYSSSHTGARAEDSDCYDFSPYFIDLKDCMQEADLCVANMEFTLAGAPFTGYPSFCAPESYADYVADCGVDVFLTANNHIFDQGPEGALRTLEVYDSMSGKGISHTGCFRDRESVLAGHPLIVEVKGTRIALLNFSYGTNVNFEEGYPKVPDMGKEELAEAMARARANADFIIALPHWGIEYKLDHSARQQETAEYLVRLGADAVIGSHPHVVQDRAVYDGLLCPAGWKKVPVVYSLGNFISNMSATNTQIGLLVTLPVIRHSDGTCTAGDPEFELTWCSLPGRLRDSHTTIPVKKYLGRRSEWKDPSDYDKMVSTYQRILEILK